MTAMDLDPDCKVSREKIAIVGVGGTGSHVLDYLSKTPVRSIDLFDGDVLLFKNTKRQPGCPVRVATGLEPNKAESYAQRYNAALRGWPDAPTINAHGEFLDAGNVGRLADYTTVFLGIQNGTLRKLALDVCEKSDVLLINMGDSVFARPDGSLDGAVSVTSFLPGKYHLAHEYVSLDDSSPTTQDLQTIEINAMNAAMAVIRWKKELGIYQANKDELDSVYWLASNHLDSAYVGGK